MSKQGRGGIEQALGNLIKWVERSPEWSGELNAVLDEHLDQAAALLGRAAEALDDDLGPEASAILFGCAWEDLTSRVYDDAPSNLVADYLQRRGWRETPQGQRYLGALSESVMSLYEVVDLDPGRWVALQDLVRPGPVLRVVEDAGSQGLEPGDRLATRLLQDLDRQIFSGVLLPISPASAEQFIASFEASAPLFDPAQASPTEYRRPKPTPLEQRLLRCAPLFTAHWLSGLQQAEQPADPDPV